MKAVVSIWLCQGVYNIITVQQAWLWPTLLTESLFIILRIPDSYDAKIAKICYLRTLWLVIQLKDHIFEIRQKAFLPNAP